MLSKESPALCAAMLTDGGYLMNYSQDQKTMAAAVIFEELHEYAKDRLPFGCDAKTAEIMIRKGLKAVRNKVQGQPAHYEQKYGIPILLILGMIPTLYNFITWLIGLFTGKES